MRVGLLGLGRMGAAMADRLLAHGTDLVVWNRSRGPARAAADRGAEVAGSAGEVFERCETVLVMLADGTAVDAVLGRSPAGFAVPVRGRTVVHLGTAAPAWSASLATHLAEHGAAYVEAPVSGSRVPAERGELVVMLAGRDADLDRVAPLLAPLASATVRCGAVPRALETKLAVNVFLIGMVTALAECVAFAEAGGTDVGVVREVLDAGPMASAVSRLKLAKLLDADHSAQAAVSDVLHNCRLITAAARERRTPLPLLTACQALLVEAERRELGSQDMVAVVEALRR